MSTQETTFGSSQGPTTIGETPKPMSTEGVSKSTTSRTSQSPSLHTTGSLSTHGSSVVPSHTGETPKPMPPRETSRTSTGMIQSTMSTGGIDEGSTGGPTLIEETPVPMLSDWTSKVTTEAPKTTQEISVKPIIEETPKPMKTSSTATTSTQPTEPMSSVGTTREPSPTGETPKPMPGKSTTKTTASTEDQNVSNPLGTPFSLSTLEKTTASPTISETPITATSTGETPRPMSLSSTSLVLTERTTSGVTFGGSETPIPMTEKPIQMLETPRPMTVTAIPMLETPRRMS